jgi:peptidylprolyl isomerase
MSSRGLLSTILRTSIVIIAAVSAGAQSATPAQPAQLPPPPDVAAAPPDAIVTPSGLASKILTPGTGTEHPIAASTVKVHYSGWTTDGQMFDSSVVRGEPSSFGVSRVIRGWTEGVQLMVKGEKRRFWIPAALAYGDNPRPGAPRGLLVFDVELFEFTTPMDAATKLGIRA